MCFNNNASLFDMVLVLQAHLAPGMYDVPSAFSSGPAFTMAPRVRPPAWHAPQAEAPGPGNYDAAAITGASGPAYTLAARGRHQTWATVEDMPGPGSYAAHGCECLLNCFVLAQAYILHEMAYKWLPF